MYPIYPSAALSEVSLPISTPRHKTQQTKKATPLQHRTPTPPLMPRRHLPPHTQLRLPHNYQRLAALVFAQTAHGTTAGAVSVDMPGRGAGF
jgi:hypothetical protein